MVKMPKKRILILVETSRAFGRQVIQGISQFSLEKGSWALLLEDRGFFDRVPFWVKRMRFDGIISRTINADSSKFLETFNVPTIELLGDGSYRTSDVLTDCNLVGSLAATHFHERGFRQFAYFSTGHSWWSQAFHDAYCYKLQKLGFVCNTSPFCEDRNESTLSITLRTKMETDILDWLVKLPKPVGLFCPSDSQAMFILNLCQVADLKVPYDIAVLGVENNAILCNATTPPLSSIAADGWAVGYQAAKLLDTMIEKYPLPELPIRLPPLGVVSRQSSDTIAVNNADVAKALHYIAANPGLRITVKDVARYTDVSLRTLIRKFKETLKRSPEEEIRRVCMERAKLLLYDTELSVAKIAENLGYSSAEYFIRSFRRATGVTPRAYRQAFRSGEES
jgi:LacI family transcriptional regulator